MVHLSSVVLWSSFGLLSTLLIYWHQHCVTIHNVPKDKNCHKTIVVKLDRHIVFAIFHIKIILPWQDLRTFCVMGNLSTATPQHILIKSSYYRHLSN